MHFLPPTTWELLKGPYLPRLVTIKLPSHALCIILSGQSTFVICSTFRRGELSIPGVRSSKGRGGQRVELTLQS